MVPQISDEFSNQPRVLGVDSGLTSGVADGRPPDQGVLIPVQPRLEREALPFGEEDQQIVKRSKGEGNEVMDVGDDVGFGTSQGLGLKNAGAGMMNGEEAVGAQGHGGQGKPSFKDMLTGCHFEGSKAHSIPELDVAMNDDDVRISAADGSPVINFSARLHGLVEEKLAKSVIVRLLGRFIGYTALLNRIRTLWNPCGEIAMIDLDNGYFLVRFALEEDVTKVLSGGPWLIYGNYLTVQPWSRSFSTEKDHPDKIVVWARLPGLPYHYYTKSMFRCIAGVLGEVVRIDYNTSEGRRGKFARLALVVDLNKPLVSSVVIDGIKQKVAYEGLPLICYKCGCYGHAEGVCPLNKKACVEGSSQLDEQGKDGSADIYGPWMLATTRKDKRGSRVMTSTARGADSSKLVMIGAGKFDVLAINDETGADEDAVIELSDQAVAVRYPGSSPVRAVDGTRVVSSLDENRLPRGGGERTAGDSRVMLQGSGSSKKNSNVSEIASLGVGEVISVNKIVPVKISLDPKAHTAVCVVEPGKEVPAHSNVGRRASAGTGLTGIRSSSRVSVGKGGERKGDSGRKKAMGRSTSKVPLSGWIEGLSAEISGGDEEPIGLEGVGDKVDRVADLTVQWRKNSSFIPKSD
ncbi:hypothetical protein GQ457_06G022560 [Hibiscus cannabinus]